MDYTYDGMLIHVETARYDREKQIYRLLVYSILLHAKMTQMGMNENNAVSDKDLRTVTFWDRESELEQKIYKNMKKWETRHPIMGIIFCTILGGILISLMAGIILEAIMMGL